MARVFLFSGVAALVAFSISGCGSDGRVGVSGTVTYDSKPLATGAINFRPKQGTKGNTAGAPIVEGEYSISAEQGLFPGEYEVNIEAMYDTGQKTNDPMKGGIVPVLMPVQYKERGSLSVTIPPAGGKDVDFTLTSP